MRSRLPTQMAVPRPALVNLSVFTSRSCLTRRGSWVQKTHIGSKWGGQTSPYIQLGYERNSAKLRTSSDDRTGTTSYYPDKTSLGRFLKRTRDLSGGEGGIWTLLVIWVSSTRFDNMQRQAGHHITQSFASRSWFHG